MKAQQLRTLIEKLNLVCRTALEEAGRISIARTNYDVEIEHWLVAVLSQPNNDVHEIFQHFAGRTEAFHHELIQTLNRLKTGNTRAPGLSQHIIRLMQEAWVLASLDHGADKIRSGHLLLAILQDSRHYGLSPAALLPIKDQDLVEKFNDITANSHEVVATRTATDSGATGQASPGFARDSALDRFTIDLTALAREGKIDPIAGRNFEIRQVVDILSRRRQNNPILIGDAGVGKTAVVEGFALRVASGDVPASLQDIAIRTLDLTLLQAGAGVRGEFEDRLRKVIDEVKSSPQPIILFIDEAHNLIGAGGQAGQGDAANLLKPALARGELRTIAATTWAEYKQYFENDIALARRFQLIHVEEPDEATAVQMLRGIKDVLERHHKIRIRNEALVEAVKLSSRYISGRQLPDKAVSVIDTACARINISQNSTPAPVEDLEKSLHALEVEQTALVGESVATVDHSERLREIESLIVGQKAEHERLTQRWQQEQEIVRQINDLYRTFLAKKSPANAAKSAASANGTEGEAVSQSEAVFQSEDDALAEVEQRITQLEEELKTLQQGQPLVHACCDHDAIAETISAWTGIPLGRMVADEIEGILNLANKLEQSVVGQRHAINLIAETIQQSRAHLSDPDKPIGVFMLAGPSGVGKTETALSLAQELFGDAQSLITINMSEFKDTQTLSKLTGSAPGLVGYGKGGMLTEPVRQRPYCVLLLDEMEKAHPQVQQTFFQVFDKGTLSDGTGRNINFRNTVIIMTTNAGSELVSNLCADPETMPSPEAIRKSLHNYLISPDKGNAEKQAHFEPAFLGRLQLIPFYPLRGEVFESIANLKLKKVAKRVRDSYHAEVEIAPNVAPQIAARCHEVDTGARNLDKIITNHLMPKLSCLILQKLAQREPIKRVAITVGENGELAVDVQ